MIKFSFIVCTYNRAASLDRTLESLCVQEYHEDEYEILVIDNNSTDDTQTICLKKRLKYKEVNFKVYMETHQGVSFARNRGVREASGEFIIFIDDDETVKKNYLSRLAEYLAEYPKAELCATPVIPVYDDGKPKWMSPFTERLIGGAFMQKAKEVKLLGKSNYPGTGHTIAKNPLFHKYGSYDVRLGRTGRDLLGAEDKDMALRWIKSGEDCYLFPDIPIYHYIGAEKLTEEYFKKLTYGIGRSERIRTLASSRKDFFYKVLNEGAKAIATIFLYIYYLITFRVSKGNRLIRFRWNVMGGLLSSDK